MTPKSWWVNPISYISYAFFSPVQVDKSRKGEDHVIPGRWNHVEKRTKFIEQLLGAIF